MSEEPRPIADPQPGYFRLRLVKGGWAVPCAIGEDEQTGKWTSIIDEQEISHIDPVEAGVFRVWIYGERIEAWQYADLLALKAWAKQAYPDHPCLHPRRAIDPMRLRPITVPDSLTRLFRSLYE